MPCSRGRLEADGGVERSDMARMHAEALACGELVGRDLPGKLEPGGSLPLEALKDEALATEDGTAEGLLHGDGGEHVRCAAEPAMAVDDVLGSRCDLDGEDPSGKLRRQHQHSRCAARLIAGEEDAPAAGDPFQPRHETFASAGIRGLAELHVRGHPGEVAMGRDDSLARIEDQLEHRENGPFHFGLHLRPPCRPAAGRPSAGLPASVCPL